MKPGLAVLPRRRCVPGLCVRVALALLLLASVLEAAGGAAVARLSRVKYRWGGREMEAVGAVSYEGEERAALRLFDEKLAGYYTVYLASGELLAVEPLGRDESEAICARREAAQVEAKERREEAARKRREARAAALRGSARERSERAGRSGAASARRGQSTSDSASRGRSIDPDDVRALRRERERRVREAQRELDRVAGAIDPLAARLDAVVLSHNENVAAVRAKMDGTPPAKVRAWVGRFESFSEDLEKLSRQLESRRSALERLRTNLSSRAMHTREARDAARSMQPRLASLEKRLVAAEESVKEYRATIARFTAADFASVRGTPAAGVLASHSGGDPMTSAAAPREAVAVAGSEGWTAAGTPARKPPRLVEHLVFQEPPRTPSRNSEAVPPAPASGPPSTATARPEAAEVPTGTAERVAPESAPAPPEPSRRSLPRGISLLLAGLTAAALVIAFRRLPARSG